MPGKAAVRRRCDVSLLVLRDPISAASRLTPAHHEINPRRIKHVLVGQTEPKPTGCGEAVGACFCNSRGHQEHRLAQRNQTWKDDD